MITWLTSPILHALVYMSLSFVNNTHRHNPPFPFRTLLSPTSSHTLLSIPPRDKPRRAFLLTPSLLLPAQGAPVLPVRRASRPCVRRLR